MPPKASLAKLFAEDLAIEKGRLDRSAGSLDEPVLVMAAKTRPKAASPTTLTIAKGKPFQAGQILPRENLPKADAWSYSRLKDWKDCPRKFYLKHIRKLREPGNDAMERGTAIHKLAEDWTLKRITEEQVLLGLADIRKKYGKATRMLDFAKDFATAMRSKPTCEENWGFTEKWEDVPAKANGWWGEGSWLKVKLDLCYLGRDKALRVVDHKTGRRYPDHDEQAELYAMAGLIKYQKVQVVRVEFWYLDSGEKGEYTFTRDQLAPLTTKWAKKVFPMMNDTQYPCKPNPGCSRCWFRSSNAEAFGGEAQCSW